MVWGLVIGASLLAGAIAAVILHLPSRVAAIVTAFGGGVLLAAIALELVPEADARAGTALTAAGLFAGTLVYVAADRSLARNENTEMVRRSGHAAAAGRSMEIPEDSGELARGEGIAMGIFVDGVPESIALGLTIAEGEVGVALLAGILIGNVVESYSELRSPSSPPDAASESRSSCWARSGWRWPSRPCSAARSWPTPATSWWARHRRSPRRAGGHLDRGDPVCLRQGQHDGCDCHRARLRRGLRAQLSPIRALSCRPPLQPAPWRVATCRFRQVYNVASRAGRSGVPATAQE